MEAEPAHGELELTVSAPVFGETLGSAVAMSGETIVASALDPYGDGDHPGAVYVLTPDEAGRYNARKLTLPATPGVEPRTEPPFEDFGGDVAISGSTVVVGVPFKSVDVDYGGAVQVFTLIADGGFFSRRIAPSTPVAGARFGLRSPSATM
ncbi:MAG: hypothetical protein AAF467_12885 [Actinomycetota bacterium]